MQKHWRRLGPCGNVDDFNYMVYAYPVVSLAAKGIHILTIFHMSHGEPVGASNRVSQPHDSFH